MNKKTTVLLTGLLALGMISQASAQVSNDTEAPIDVQISEKTAIDISPESLDFGSIVPGQNISVDTSGWSAVEVENVGSSNITSVYFNTSVPSSNPFGTGVASNYDVGNWIQIRPQETNMEGIPNSDTAYFVNRVDFNESNDLSYVNVPDNFDYGRFRVADEEYFWAVNSTGGVAAGCGDELRVGQTPHTRQQTGTVDLVNNGVSTSLSAGPNGNYAVAPSVNVGGKTYDVLVECQGASTSTVRTRYNPEPLGVDISGAGGVAVSLLNASEQDMYPGEHFTTNVSLSIPRGVAASNGALTGTLSVVATS